MTRSWLPAALLVVASAASIATSSEEPPPPPVGATSSASVDGVVAVAAGSSVRRTFEVGVELDQMPQITDSWVTLHADVQANSGTASLRVVVDGFDQSNEALFSANSSSVTNRQISVNGVDTGCLGQGDLCWSTWTVDIVHTGGTGGALVEYRFEAAVDGITTPIFVNEQ